MINPIDAINLVLFAGYMVYVFIYLNKRSSYMYIPYGFIHSIRIEEATSRLNPVFLPIFHVIQVLAVLFISAVTMNKHTFFKVDSVIGYSYGGAFFLGILFSLIPTLLYNYAAKTQAKMRKGTIKKLPFILRAVKKDLAAKKNLKILSPLEVLYNYLCGCIVTFGVIWGFIFLINIW